MSLISDALKKADGKSGLEPPPSRSLWIYRIALIGCVGIVLIGLVQLTRRPALPPTGNAKAVRTETAKPSGIPLLRMAQGDLALSGIIRGGDGKPLALINNQIVQAGDRVKGMTVVQVNRSTVEVADHSGKTRTLKLN